LLAILVGGVLTWAVSGSRRGGSSPSADSPAGEVALVVLLGLAAAAAGAGLLVRETGRLRHLPTGLGGVLGAVVSGATTLHALRAQGWELSTRRPGAAALVLFGGAALLGRRRRESLDVVVAAGLAVTAALAIRWPHSSAPGRVAVLLGALIGLGLLLDERTVRTGARARRHVPEVGAGLLVISLAGAALPPALAGQPVEARLSRARLGDVAVSAYVQPRPDGTTALYVGSSPAANLTAAVDGVARPLGSAAPGLGMIVLRGVTAPVTLSLQAPDGSSARLRLATPTRSRPQDLTDNPDRWLGRLISGRISADHATMVDPGPAGDGEALARALSLRGLHTIGLVTGTTSRALLAANALRHTAIGLGLRVVDEPSTGPAHPATADVVVLATEREQASALLARLGQTGKAPPSGVWAVPWLLDRTVLDTRSAAGATTSPPPLVFALSADPLGTVANGYLATMALRAPGQPVTYDGLLGWLDEHPATAPSTPTWQLYVAGDAAFLPPSLSAGHADGSSLGWLSNGGINPASGPLALQP
jgi:hypothetical protein